MSNNIQSIPKPVLLFNPFANCQGVLANATQGAKQVSLCEEVTSPSTDYHDNASHCSEFRASRQSSSTSLGDNEHVKSLKLSRFSFDTKASDSEEMESEIEEQAEVPKSTQVWHDKHDKTLKSLAQKCKYDWKKIAKKFNARQKSEFEPVFLQHKYKQITKPSIPLRVKFTREEDLMIAKYFDQFGCDWAKIATFFTDRTAIMLKNRYYSHIRKRDLLGDLLEEAQMERTEEEKEEVEEAIEETSHNIKVEDTSASVQSTVGFNTKSEEVEPREFTDEDFSFINYLNNVQNFDMDSELRCELNERVTDNLY